MKYAHKAIALSLALILAAPMIQLISAAPAAAGNWTASTPDDLNGNSIVASGSSTETVDGAGNVTTCTESTTTYTSLATGKVVKVIKRKRCITKKGKLPNQQVLHLTSAEVQTVNNDDGTSTVVSHDQTNDGNTSKSSDNTQQYSKPDGQGDLMGGDATRTNFDGKNTTKEHDKWDPAKGQWVAVNDAPHRMKLLLPILGAAALIFGLAHHNGSDQPVQPNTQQPQTEPAR
jgi:hypothetical protein